MQAVFANAILKAELCRCYSSRMESPNTSLCIKRWSPNPMQATYVPKLFCLLFAIGFLKLFCACSRNIIFQHTCCNAMQAVSANALKKTELCRCQPSGMQPQMPHSSSRADLPNPCRQHMPQSCFIYFCSRFSKVVWCLFQKPYVLIHLL